MDDQQQQEPLADGPDGEAVPVESFPVAGDPFADDPTYRAAVVDLLGALA